MAGPSGRGSRGGSSNRGRGSHTGSLEDVSRPVQVVTPSYGIVPTTRSLFTSFSRIPNTSTLSEISHQHELDNQSNTSYDRQTEPARKKGRSFAGGVELEAFVAANGKIPLIFNPKTGRPTHEKHSSWFSSECGSIARRFTPGHVRSWGDLDDVDFASLIDRLQEFGEPLGDVALFKQKDGWLRRPRGCTLMEDFRSMHSSESSQPMPKLEIIKYVIGEWYGYIKGRGWGPLPTKSDGAESSRATEERTKLVHENQATKEEVRAQRKEMCAYQEKINSLQQTVTSLMSMMRASSASISEFSSRPLEDPSQSPPRYAE